MSEPRTAKPKVISVAPTQPGGVLSRLDKLEDSVLRELQEIRAINAELRKQADTSPKLEKLLDAKAVAELFGETERWVYKQVKAKELPAIRLGKYWKFSPAAIQKWIEKKQQGIL